MESSLPSPQTGTGVGIPSLPQRRPGREVLEATVREIKASGALVELPDGQEAWLPACEIHADFHPHEDLRDRPDPRPGRQLDVVGFGAAFGGRRRLVSHIRVSDDPWDAVAAWQDGQIKAMEVTATTAARAIGLIAPGIHAEVHLPALEEQLPPRWRGIGRPLVADEVAGVFRHENVDHDKRIVLLDVAA
ncbi:MAG: hypothetical protein ACYS1C_08755, partial [Planctomycetota bacterium]